MPVQLEIADDIVASLRIPLPEVQEALMRELAFTLYAKWALPIGKARAMASLTKREFLSGLAQRGISRHYTEGDLTEDVAYARGGE